MPDNQNTANAYYSLPLKNIHIRFLKKILYFKELNYVVTNEKAETLENYIYQYIRAEIQVQHIWTCAVKYFIHHVYCPRILDSFLPC